MGYEMPIVCKDLYLPIEDDDSLSFDEYKAKYGIDLKQYFKLVNNDADIMYNPPKYTKVYCVSSTSFTGMFMSIMPAFGSSMDTSHSHGVSDALTIIGSFDGAEGDNFGIRLIIPKEIENPTLDDVVISKELA